MKVSTAGEKRRPDIDTSDTSRVTSGSVTGCVRTPGMVGENSGRKRTTKSGCDHHLDPILAFALEADTGREPMLAQSVGEVISVFAVDPTQVCLPGDINDRDTVLLFKPMAGREGDAEPLAVEGEHVEPLVEWLGLRHHREIEFSLQQNFREGGWYAFDQGQLASGVCGVDLR